jgi:hypothetical protein
LTLVRRGSAKKKHEARAAWLQPRVHLFADVPGIRDDVTNANRGGLDQLCDLMDAAKLFGQAPRETRRETVRRLLSELRGEDVGLGW